MRPPRIPNLLPGDRDTLYFLTLCTHKRAKVLDNPLTWSAVRAALKRLNRWEFPAGLAMPDHLHLLAGPKVNRDESVSLLLQWLKRWIAEELGYSIPWQEGGHDRLLRTGESATGKWHYIRENPVRAGLVENWMDWPYRFGFCDDLPDADDHR
jgi:putative transposase